MFVNIIESYRNVVAVADAELIGKNFYDGIKQLEVKESFYKGENEKPLSEEEVKEIMFNMKKEDSTFNIVGKRSIRCAIEIGIITEDSVFEIDGIPYSLILL